MGIRWTSHSFGGWVQGADLLLIDSFYANTLTTKTVTDAAAVMHNANILIHDRSSFGLRVLRKVGQSSGLEFL